MTPRANTKTTARRGNLEGSNPRQRSDGRWQVNFDYTDADGVARKSSVYGKTRPEVRRKAKEFAERIAAGMPGADTTETVASFARSWVKGSLQARAIKETTKANYAYLASSYVIKSDLGGMPLAKVAPRHVEGWLAELRERGVSASTVRLAFLVLCQITKVAVRDKAIPTDPTAGIDRPSPIRVEAHHLTPEALAVLLAQLRTGTRWAPLFEFLAFTGLRRGEALALTWADVDLARRVVNVNKTLGVDPHDGSKVTVTSPKSARSRRSVSLSDPALAALIAAQEQTERDARLLGSDYRPEGYVFANEWGGPGNPRNVLRRFQDVARRAGFPNVKIHTLRHSAASIMLTNNVPLKVVSEMLGHASVAITGDVYGHVSPEVREDAAAKLGAALGAFGGREGASQLGHASAAITGDVYDHTLTA